MAVLRASIEGAQVVLASATPSVESWVNAGAGKYRRIDLRSRYGEAELPAMAAIAAPRGGSVRASAATSRTMDSATAAVPRRIRMSVIRYPLICLRGRPQSGPRFGRVAVYSGSVR